MPEDAYRARVEVDGVVPSSVLPGESLALAVVLTNESPHSWSARAAGAIRAGNHWLTASGDRMLVQDDGRAALPPELRPGETCRVVVEATAPDEPGAYQLELDVVHEGISWFADKGSRPWRTRLLAGADSSVESLGGSSATTDPDRLRLDDYDLTLEAGELPMHGVARDRVEQVIRESGCTLLHVEVDERGGTEWVGYRYFTKKR
jgi:hypothetical protein